jgi:hypothetical protein
MRLADLPIHQPEAFGDGCALWALAAPGVPAAQ